MDSSLAGLLEHNIGCNEPQSALASQSAQAGKEQCCCVHVHINVARNDCVTFMMAWPFNDHIEFCLCTQAHDRLISDCKGNVRLPKARGEAAMHANKEVSVDALC